MPDRRVFVLNLDAEDELRTGPGYTPSDAVRAHSRALAPRLADLVGDDLAVFPFDAPLPRLDGAPGRVFAVTPRSVETLRLVTGGVPHLPRVDVVRRVSDRAFSLALGHPAGGRLVRSMDELGVGDRPLLVKRTLSFAGRGHLALRPPVAPRDLERVAAWIAKDGSVAIEPLFDRTLDASIHGLLADDGTVRLGVPTVSDIGRDGRWLGSSRHAGRLADAEVSLLERTARDVADALFAEGYFGPFNLDGFRHTGGFVPCCEINPRYSMGFAVGMS